MADMTPAYLAGLDHGQNIGVVLGTASERLCTIDADMTITLRSSCSQFRSPKKPNLARRTGRECLA